MPAKYRADSNPHRRLRHAAWKGDVMLAQELIIRGADVHGVDVDGFTALLVAARWNRAEMCRYLVEKQGADVATVNKEGDNAYNLAKAFGHHELAGYLETVGCSTAPCELRQQRQRSVDAWLEVVRPTPSQLDIARVREMVTEKYVALKQRQAMAADEALVGVVTGLQGGALKQHMAQDVMGQLTFPVGQKVVKAAPRNCRLGVGSMGLALFDGVRPVTTWPYKFITDARAIATKTGGQLLVVLAGPKKRDLVFSTMHAEALVRHIAEQMSVLSQQEAMSPRPVGGDASTMLTPRAASDPESDTVTACWPAALPAGGGGGGVGGALGTPSEVEEGEPPPPPPLDQSRSIWVGGIPEALVCTTLTASVDYEDSALAAMFARFGSIVSLTTRPKSGLNKSWALVTYREASSVACAGCCQPRVTRCLWTAICLGHTWSCHEILRIETPAQGGAGGRGDARLGEAAGEAGAGGAAPGTALDGGAGVGAEAAAREGGGVDARAAALPAGVL
jgi:hypothetical protein